MTLPANALKLTLATMICYSVSAHAVWEAAIFGVNDYDPCNSDDLAYCDDNVATWEAGLDGLSYSNTTINTNANVDGRDWIDAHIWLAGGADNVSPWGTDWADVAVFAGHGNHYCDSTNGYYSYIVMGDDDEDCRPSEKDDLRFHNGGTNEELNYVYFLACETVQKCVFLNGGYDNMDAGADFDFQAGYHGIVLDNSVNDALYGTYIDSAENNGLGDDWLDLLTIIHSGSNNDECATVVIRGSSQSETDDVYNYGGLKDKHSTGANSVLRMYGIGGCDPNDGEAL